MLQKQVVIIGAGASGLMCAIEAAKRGRQVLVIDHANKPGKKILMSGGGRCNFTNYEVSAEHYLSENPHFCKSALSRFSQWDFLAMIERYCIPYHERDHGQLFCDRSAKDVLGMLLKECKKNNVEMVLKVAVNKITARGQKAFNLETSMGPVACEALVIATGGLSIPKMGASSFGYKVAKQFAIRVRPTRAGLVPFTLSAKDKKKYASLSGIAVEAIVNTEAMSFRENILFTHRGLSGPVVLQISSYWQPGMAITVDFLPDICLNEAMSIAVATTPNQGVKRCLARWLPKRLIAAVLEDEILNKQLSAVSQADIRLMETHLKKWVIIPSGTEGYRTAEVTLGGVACDEVSSKTFEAKKVPGLYFVGEVLDVTGWLGGYNFQWAWASGWCAGQYT